MLIKIKSESGMLPEYKTKGCAGMDIKAYLQGQNLTLEPGARVLVPTGLYLEMKPGYEAQIRARSGNAIKHGIGLVNGIGTIDSDYRGEIKVALINWGDKPFKIEDGDRIAQVVFASYEQIEWEPVKKTDELSSTVRGAGGFGHTGTK